MKRTLLAATFVGVFASSAFAQEEVSESVPMSYDPQKSIELRLGLAAGGPVGLLVPVDGVKRITTEPFTTTLYLRARLPKLSSRIVEVYGVLPNGIGVNFKNDDFRLGKFRFSLVDVGFFWNANRPVSVQRVRRDFDLTFGTGVEYLASETWAVSLDWRVFFPADVFKVLTDYGDFARLVGREAVQGGQVWLGFSYSW